MRLRCNDITRCMRLTDDWQKPKVHPGRVSRKGVVLKSLVVDLHVSKGMREEW